MRGGGPEGILGRPKAPDCSPKKRLFWDTWMLLARFGNDPCPFWESRRELLQGKKAGINPLDANSRCPCGFGDPNPAADPLFLSPPSQFPSPSPFSTGN